MHDTTDKNRTDHDMTDKSRHDWQIRLNKIIHITTPDLKGSAHEECAINSVAVFLSPTRVCVYQENEIGEHDDDQHGGEVVLEDLADHGLDHRDTGSELIVRKRGERLCGIVWIMIVRFGHVCCLMIMIVTIDLCLAVCLC